MFSGLAILSLVLFVGDLLDPLDCFLESVVVFLGERDWYSDGMNGGTFDSFWPCRSRLPSLELPPFSSISRFRGSRKRFLEFVNQFWIYFLDSPVILLRVSLASWLGYGLETLFKNHYFKISVAFLGSLLLN